MRTIQTAVPRAELKEFVQAYAQREIGCDGSEFSQPNSPGLEQGIGFHFDGKTILDYPDGRSRLAPKAYIFGGLTPPPHLIGISFVRARAQKSSVFHPLHGVQAVCSLPPTL